MQNRVAGVPPQVKPISKSVQPHRFFDIFLNNDLERLADFLSEQYPRIVKSELPGMPQDKPVEAWKSSGSVSTMKWKDYNVFQFYNTEIYNLYVAVGKMVREACEYYGINFEEQRFMIQGWFNINHAKVGKLDWHEHGDSGAPMFHGYYAVKAEPSETHYITTQGPKTNINQNNRAVLSEMGHPHAMGDWSWDGPRITVAYDIVPLSHLENDPKIQEQHWLPLN